MSRPVAAKREELRAASRHVGAPSVEKVAGHFRVAHAALLAEGLAIAVVGGVALALSKAGLRFGGEGMPLLGLALTPLHGGLLIVSGVLAVLVCIGRWSTVVFTAVAGGLWVLLAIVCAVHTADRTPGILGFDARDTVLYAVLGVYNLVVFLWLVPTLAVTRRTARNRKSLP
jgi:hypothetical protein